MKNNEKKLKNNQKGNKRRKALNCIVGCLALLGSAGTITFGTLWCQSRKMPTPEQDDVTFNKTSLTLDINETETLFAKVGPDGANQEVTWTSSNESVAKVNSKGLVTAVSAGTATITVKAAHSSKTAKCNVEVVTHQEEIDVTLNQLTQWDYESMYYYYTMHPSQPVEVKPNTRYNITIDMTNFDMDRQDDLLFYCEFTDDPASDERLVDFSYDFAFKAIDNEKNSWPMCGKLDMSDLNHFTQISFQNEEDFDYIISSNTIVGHLTTANFTETIEPCYLVFGSCTY